MRGVRGVRGVEDGPDGREGRGGMLKRDIVVESVKVDAVGLDRELQLLHRGEERMDVRAVATVVKGGAGLFAGLHEQLRVLGNKHLDHEEGGRINEGEGVGER